MAHPKNGERPLRALPCAGGVGNGPPGWFLPARGAGGLCDSVWSSRSLPVSSVVPRSPEVCGLGPLCLTELLALWVFLLLLLALFSEITKFARFMRDSPRSPTAKTNGSRFEGNRIINPHSPDSKVNKQTNKQTSLVYTPTICKNFDALAESSEFSSSLFDISLARAFCLGKQFQRGIHMSS